MFVFCSYAENGIFIDVLQPKIAWDSIRNVEWKSHAAWNKAMPSPLIPLVLGGAGTAHCKWLQITDEKEYYYLNYIISINISTDRISPEVRSWAKLDRTNSKLVI